MRHPSPAFRPARWIVIPLVLACASVAQAQIPATAENLQYFPKDIPREELIQRMRQFSFALGVRCQHCHTGGNGISFEGVNFASDEKDAKRKARHMLRMVDEINGRVLQGLPSRVSPPAAVACVTCHRGLPVPRTLGAVLEHVIQTESAAAAAARYRQLRQDASHLGQYNFGEWTLNELASELHRSGRTDAGITMLLTNAEFYPKSAAIDQLLADLYLAKGDTGAAIQRLRAVLDRQPGNARASQLLAELEKR